MSKPQCYYCLSRHKINVSLDFVGVFMSICSRRATLAKWPKMSVSCAKSFYWHWPQLGLTVPQHHRAGQIQRMIDRRCTAVALLQVTAGQGKEEQGFCLSWTQTGKVWMCCRKGSRHVRRMQRGKSRKKQRRGPLWAEGQGSGGLPFLSTACLISAESEETGRSHS